MILLFKLFFIRVIRETWNTKNYIVFVFSMLLFGAICFMLIALSWNLSLFIIHFKQYESILNLINNVFPYILVFDIIIRILFQSSHRLEIKKIVFLPIRKTEITCYILFFRLIHFTNLLGMCALFPALMKIENISFFSKLTCFFYYFLFIQISNYSILLLQILLKDVRWFWFSILIGVFILSFKSYLIEFSYQFTKFNYLFLIPLMYFCAIIYCTFYFVRQNLTLK